MGGMEIIVSRKTKFKNKELAASTARMRKAGESVRINVYRIASELARIHEKKLWVEDGYDDVTDYANKILHIRKTMCYDLIKIGKTFVSDTGRCSNLTRPEGMRQDYTVGQLRAMLPIGYDKAEELCRDGVITPDMSVRTIMRIVKFNGHENVVDFLQKRNFNPAEFEDGIEYAPEVEVTTEISQPEPLLTIVDDEIFITDCFKNLSREQVLEIIKICDKSIASEETED